MVLQRRFILALAAALLMLFLVGSVASADGNVGSIVAQTTTAKGEVCVDGYVINHREQPVDGTKTVPPLVVEAVMAGSTTDTATAAVVATATVGKDGYFKFTGLRAGAYNFRLKLPAGWEGIVPQVTLGGTAETGFTEFKKSSTCYRIIFKIRRLVTITVIKWEEQLNGSVVPGNDWTITATPVNDPFAKTVTVTTKDGQALLTLTPGTWNVTETLKSGWTALTPTTVQRVVDQYQPEGATNPIVFKNRQPACYPKIIVTKQGFATNSDGTPKALGTLAGWQFTVARADATAPSVTKTTAGDGRAIFDNLTPGVYTVTETVQAGWKSLTNNPLTVVLSSCADVPVTFENQELLGTLNISGKKLFKAWEPPYKGTLIGLPGWTITATLVGTDQYATTVTNALGEYLFTQTTLKNAGLGFPGATIKVCEEKRDHWIPETPECVTVTFPYPVPTDYTGAKVDFTNFQDPPPTATTARAARASRPAVARAACGQTYVVRSGDTVANVASKLGVSGSSLIRANGIKNADRIYVGQVFCVP